MGFQDVIFSWNMIYLQISQSTQIHTELKGTKRRKRMEISKSNNLNNALEKGIVGKPVETVYGWTVGKVIGVLTDFRDSLLYLGIELVHLNLVPQSRDCR